MNTHTVNPTPDAVLAALWETDFDLPRAAKALLIPLTLLLRLLNTPEFAEPLNQLHELSRRCLDIRAAKALARSLDLLDAAYGKSDDPAEHRRIATAVTKAANAAARLTRPGKAATRGASAARGAGIPPAAARAASVLLAQATAAPAEPSGTHPEVAQAYHAMRKAWTAVRANSNPSTQEEFARRYNEWKALETHFSPGPVVQHAA